MNTAPTYRAFRAWALAQGYTPETLAPFVQADNPLKTAERLLIHLAGTRWDDEPLPYPKLRQLYRGSDAPAPAAPAPRGHVELADALISGRKDRPWLKPDQYTVTHCFTDPYLYVTLDADAPREGIKTLAHLAGALYLETDQDGPRVVRFPYEVLCRLAGMQWRSRGDQRAKALASMSTPVVSDAEAPRLCPCGAQLTGQASQRFCSPRCRMKASRANPHRIAKKRGSKSVTAMIIPTTPLLHRIEPARRADGSLRDTFSDVPTPALLDRMSTEAIEHNKRTKMKYGLGYWE
jgi:hypothetical protein